MDTKLHTYSELSNEIGIHTGGIYLENNLYRRVDDFEKYRLSVDIRGKVFFEKIDQALELVEEMLFQTKVEDKKRLYEIICEGKTNLQGFLLRASDAAAAVRNLSYLSKAGAISEKIKGITNYKFIEKLEADFDSYYDETVKNLQKLIHYVFRRSNLTIGYTANDRGYELFADKVQNLLKHLEENESYAGMFAGEPEEIPVEKKNEGFKNSAQVQYVTRAGNFVKKGYPYDASLRVLKTILGSEYLWKHIREQGGAYGCNCVFSKSGESYFSSYRDPNLAKTNDVFQQVPEYIRNFDADERNMTKYIIGTISPMETPLTAVGKGNRSMSAYFSGETVENLKKEKQQVLNTDQEKIRSLADTVQAVLEDDSICVVGNEGKIEEDRALFMNVINLFE